MPHSENILFGWLGKAHGGDRLGDGWVHWLAESGWEEGWHVMGPSVTSIPEKEHIFSTHVIHAFTEEL